MSILQSPVRLGLLTLRNRVVMAPLTRCRADPGRIPNARMVEYYRQRAGAGLILSEATAISPTAVGYPDTPGIWSEEQVRGWKAVTDAVHARGGVMLCQLWHVGRVSDPIYLDGALPVAPSAVAAPGHVSLVRPQRPYVTPRALETKEIAAIVADYHRAAENAKRAGFDGVEIHGANGYLVHQFLFDGTNRRTDRYGGSLPNRFRFLGEVLDTVISVWGAERVGLHLSPSMVNEAMFDSYPDATFEFVAREAARLGLAFLFLREAPGPQARAALIKRAFQGPIIVNENLDRATAQALLEAGAVDAVGFGKAYIANPDLAERLFAGAALNQPRSELFYGGGDEGYLDYPTLQRLA